MNVLSQFFSTKKGVLQSIFRTLFLGLILTGFNLQAQEATDSTAVKPQTIRPVTSAYWAEIGSSQLADTYLTPLVYHGYHLGVNYSRMQAMRFAPERWTMALDLALKFDHADNPAGNASMLYAHVAASWGMMRKWKLPNRLTLAAGGSTGVDLGCFYNGRNGNNPASAKAAWTVNLTGAAAWQTRLFGRQLSLAYRPSMPIVGAFFSPEYDELYYEISLGNHKHLAHAAFPWNFFRLDNLITADLRLGSTSLRIGFRSEVLSTKVSGIVTRCFTNSFVIGATSDWIGFSPQLKVSDDTRIALALY